MLLYYYWVEEQPLCLPDSESQVDFFYFELDRENLYPSEIRIFHVKNPEKKRSKCEVRLPGS